MSEIADTVSLTSAMAILRKIFKPASPTNDRDLFRGRKTQFGKVMGSIEEEGQHAVLYGEPGVGKTSLAWIAIDVFTAIAPDTAIAIRVPCTVGDDFESVCGQITEKLQATIDLADEGLAAALQPILTKIETIFGSSVLTSNLVARALNLIASKVPLLVVIDEFDRLGGDRDSSRQFAELIKTLADEFIPCTLVLVGVADDVSGLLEGHQSISRHLKSIAMPRMTADELEQVVTGGFATFSERSSILLRCTPRAVKAIVRMSEGFPYYTHLLASHVGFAALERGVSVIDETLVLEALMEATEDAAQQIKTSYSDAIAASRSDATYAQTLLACALAPTNDIGFFRPSDVVDPLQRITGTPKSTANFLKHLEKFSGPDSWILETRGEDRRTRYRFTNPLMKPFVLLKGYDSGDLKIHEELQDVSDEIEEGRPDEMAPIESDDSLLAAEVDAHGGDENVAGS